MKTNERPGFLRDPDHSFEFPGCDIGPDAVEFGRAMERYQRQTGRRYPAWLEVLNIAKDMGWRKVL